MTRILTIAALLFATPAWAETNNIKNMFSIENILLLIVIVLTIALAMLSYLLIRLVRSTDALNVVRQMEMEASSQIKSEKRTIFSALSDKAAFLALTLHGLRPEEFTERYRDLLRRIETNEYIPSLEKIESDLPIWEVIDQVYYAGARIDEDIANFDDDFSRLEVICFYIFHLSPEWGEAEWLSVAWFDTFGFDGKYAS
jgi:hypothetical protein